MAAHNPTNNQQPHLQEQVDGRTASKSALDTGDQHNTHNWVAYCS